MKKKIIAAIVIFLLFAITIENFEKPSVWEIGYQRLKN
jgi:hypothetical protein